MAGDGSASYDVIVAGVGSAGSAACYHLARRGARVLGLERFEIPHANGSHHGHSRIIRQSYYEHPDYVPLLRRAYALWDELQQAGSDDPFFHITGGLFLGPEDGAIISGALRSAREHGLPHAMLSHQEVRDRFPAFRQDDEHSAFHEDRGGFLVPERAVRAHADAALAIGAEVQTNEVIRSWTAQPDHVEVVTDRGTYTAEQLVISSGVWSAEVIAGLGIELQVTRQILAWFEPLGDLSRLGADQFPCWFIETAPPFGHYGFPLMPGDPGLKIAEHKPGEPIAAVDVDLPNPKPRPDEIAALRAVFERYFPGCTGELAQACVCRYTNSPDGHFIVGKHPAHERVSIACGLSGHGFKFASVLGEVLAQFALDGKSELAIEFLSPERFI